MPWFAEQNLLAAHFVLAQQLPLQAVIERQLINPVAANSVNTAVTHVADCCTIGTEHQRRARGPHSLKVFVLRSTVVDGLVRDFDRLFESGLNVFVTRLEERLRQCVGRKFAGKFACRVSAHAIGDEQDVPVLLPDFGFSTKLNNRSVLVVLTTKTDIAERAVCNHLLPAHRHT